MDIQKINWKVFLEDPAPADPDIFFRVFNTWIPDSPEIFVDVADYRHVHDGPLTALIGHHTDYWLDETDGRRGLLYNRRTRTEGSNKSKLTKSLRDILSACRRLEADPAFGGKLRFSGKELLFLINDRAIAPNTPETYRAVKPDLEEILARAAGGAESALEHLADDRRRFSVKIKFERPQNLGEMISRLGG
ncbi:hypothetical protein HY522_04145 [bacterium]|nr:hypothetical protein [bacterium]